MKSAESMKDFCVFMHLHTHTGTRRRGNICIVYCGTPRNISRRIISGFITSEKRQRVISFNRANCIGKPGAKWKTGEHVWEGRAGLARSHAFVWNVSLQLHQIISRGVYCTSRVNLSIVWYSPWAVS